MTTSHSIRTAPAGVAHAGAAPAGRPAQGGQAPGAFFALLSSLGASAGAEPELLAEGAALDPEGVVADLAAGVDPQAAPAGLGAPAADRAAAEAAALLQGAAGGALPMPPSAPDASQVGAAPAQAAPDAAAQASGAGGDGAAAAVAGAMSAVPASTAPTSDAPTQGASPAGAQAVAAPQRWGAALAGPGSAGTVRADGAVGLQAAALAQAGQAVGQAPAHVPVSGPAAAAEEAAAVQALAAGASGLGAGLVAQTARMDAGNAVALDGGARTSWQRPGAARPAAPAGALRNGAAQAWAQALEPARGKAQAPAAALGVARPDPPALPVAAQAQSPVLPEPAAVGGLGGAADPSAALAQTLAAAGLVSEARPGRSPAAAGERPAASAVVPGPGWAEPGATALPDATATAPAGPAASAEEAVAEQVTYWLNDNLKNAELTLEHAGQPVDVRVSIAGNEAHVAFRSDQAQTRELLAARMDQLRELLNAEGLVLAGTSVDAGASGQAGGRGGREAPAGAPTAQVRAAGEVAAPAPRRSLGTGAVDLYV